MKQPRLRAWRLARAARRAESKAAPSAPSPDLSAIAAKADDLLEIKKSVEDAASVSGGLWLSYLFVLLYLAIAAGAVTHEDLLLKRPVKLPFLNVELPLLAFFALAPFIVLIVHAYALMHFIMLGKKASRFHTELRVQFPDGGRDNNETRDKLRRLLPSNIFVQILAGPPELRHGAFGFMLKLIAMMTLVVFPILILLLLQIQFLPFHDLEITNAQRTALFLDIVLLWLLWPPILADVSMDGFWVRVRAQILRDLGLILFWITSIAVLWFSIIVATIPREWQETALAALDPPRWQIPDVMDKQKTKLVSTHELVFAGPVNSSTRRRDSLFSNTLVLPGFNLFDALKIDDPKKLAWKEHLIDLRGRHLEHAVFDGADLTKADLYGAYLLGALLNYAKLQGATLSFADLQGASLTYADLQSASLDYAQLQGASLINAQLQGASLDRAHLQGATLVLAQLQGASLDWAQLQGASLDYAHLQGASLVLAQLQGASLDYAQLQGASLINALLQGASLDRAQLQGATLVWARLQGEELEHANVRATDFSRAILWRTQWGGIDLKQLGTVRLKDATWKNSEWTDKAYDDLRELMKSIPEGRMRVKALGRIETLDCGISGKTLPLCNAATPPPAVLDLQKVKDPAYAKALATEMANLVCARDSNAIYILRGISKTRLGQTDREAPRLVDFIMSKNCPVSAALTDGDKASLLGIKRDAEKRYLYGPTTADMP